MSDTVPVHVMVDYAEKRRKAYPSIEDQLDAIWKGGAEMEAMRQRVLAVKTNLPKTKGVKNER